MDQLPLPPFVISLFHVIDLPLRVVRAKGGGGMRIRLSSLEFLSIA